MKTLSIVVLLLLTPMVSAQGHWTPGRPHAHPHRYTQRWQHQQLQKRVQPQPQQRAQPPIMGAPVRTRRPFAFQKVVDFGNGNVLVKITTRVSTKIMGRGVTIPQVTYVKLTEDEFKTL